MADEIREFEVDSASDGMRLDRFLAQKLGEDSSRSQLRRWLDEGHVARLDGGDHSVEKTALKASHKIRAGEIYRVRPFTPEPSALEPVDLNLEVLHEDDSLAVIIKPPGIAVHAGPRDTKVTLVNGLLHRWSNLPGALEPDAEYGEPAPVRPGLVHRLDRATEGLLIIAKNERARRKLSEVFKERRVYKEYLAWCAGAPREASGRIVTQLERHPHERLKMRVADASRGREAVTEYRVERLYMPDRGPHQGRKFIRAIVSILTGRTHQIRVHMNHIGAPVVGDPLYSRSAARFEKYGMLLLARKLRFPHPESGAELEFEIPTPDRFAAFEKMIRAGCPPE